MPETIEQKPQTEETPPLNLAEVRDTTDINLIAKKLEEHPESAPVVEEIRKKAAKILGRSVVDIKNMNINDIREDLDKETKSVDIHKTPAEKLSGAIDALLHSADSLDYVKELLKEV